MTVITAEDCRTAITFRESGCERDEEWDGFLKNARLGQFQQSSAWAGTKMVEGWTPFRIVAYQNETVVGGFQICYRDTRLGRMGYVSKGPVLDEEVGDLADRLLKRLLEATAALGIEGLIVQPPDRSKVFPALMRRDKFMPFYLLGIISSTLMIDLTGGGATLRKGMRRTTITEIKQAVRRGVRIREGGFGDLEHFFRLMEGSCRRQGVRPSPASADSLRELWKRFSPAGCIRLTFAECDGEAVSGALCLAFGDRVTIWKKGWASKCADRKPNSLLCFEALEWSGARGYRYFDFVSLDGKIARSILERIPLSASQRRGRDFFHLGFGGEPVLLPEAGIFIARPGLRLGYKWLMCNPFARIATRQVLRRRA